MKRRIKTNYPGVYYREARRIGGKGSEKVYYVVFKKDGRMHEEKAGRQYADGMTAARAAGIRAERIEGKRLSRKEIRELEKARKKAEATRWTIDRLWEEYRIQKPGLKGVITDENRYQNYIKARFGDKEPKEIIQFDVDRLRIRLLKKRSPQTVKHVLALLKRIVNFGVKKHLCQGLSFTMEMPKVHNLVTEDLTPDELSRLLEAVNNDSDTQAGNMMKIALFTGMRRGEILRLRWDDVNLERGFLTIRDPKGGPHQKIPLNEAAREVLESQLRSNSPLVFPGNGGRQRTVLNSRFLNRIKEKAGLPKGFRPLHGLRHVYASMLASSGKVDMYTLQKLLTHKSPVMTQRYAHLRDEALKRAADVAGDLIEQALNGKGQDRVVHLEDKKE